MHRQAYNARLQEQLQDDLDDYTGEFCILLMCAVVASELVLYTVAASNSSTNIS